MHLSREIQAQLYRMNSSVKLSDTIYGELPDNYAYLHEGICQFTAEFASSQNEFSIVLFGNKDDKEYNYCYARAVFRDIKRLALVINLWVTRQKNAIEIKQQFEEIELFENFKITNPNPDIEWAWTKVKNIFFRNLKFWDSQEWNGRYLELLNKAKEHIAFRDLFPFTSHYWLRFSVDKNITQTWELSTYIIPLFYSQEIPESLGKFYVSYNEKPQGGRFFSFLDEALDFYAEKLKETKPVHWTLP